MIRPFQKLDPISLKAFYFAALELNFTRAAQSAGLTQSGISQHIQRLEGELGQPLFRRERRQVHLTAVGKELLRYVESYLDSLESFLEGLQKQGSALKGAVNYAMPESCLFTPHMGMLLEKRQHEFPEIEIHVQICDSSEVLAHLQQGKIDFGFITKPLGDRNMNWEEFAREEFVMVCDQKRTVPRSSQELRQLNFVSYPGMEDLYAHWYAAEFPKAKLIPLNELNVAGKINSLMGAIKMVEGGMGVAIFQKHCVQAQLDKKSLYAMPSKHQKPQNPIYVVTPKEQKTSLRVQRVIDTFWAMKQ